MKLLWFRLPGATVVPGNLRLRPWFDRDFGEKYAVRRSKHLTTGIYRVAYLENEAFYLHSHHWFATPKARLAYTHTPVTTKTLSNYTKRWETAKVQT